MTRQIEEPNYSENEIVGIYESLHEVKKEIFKWEKNQFGPPEEEEGGEEESEEEGEGESEEKGEAESSDEE